MTETPTLRTLRLVDRYDRLPEVPEPVLISSIRPNGLLAGAVPTGVPQHELARPHFAFDQPIEFSDIKAGEDNIWFQRKSAPPLWTTDEPLAYFAAAPIRGVKQPDDNHRLWEIEYDVPSAAAFYSLNPDHWQAYRRYLWVPLGWGTPDGYPERQHRKQLLADHVGNLRKVLHCNVALGVPSVNSFVCQMTEEFLEKFPEDPGPDLLEFVLHPKWVDSNFDGQGDRIPDMPNQKPQGGEGEGEGGAGNQPGENKGDGEGEGEGGNGGDAEPEIPPMPGDPGYGFNTKYDHAKQTGWWGSETGA